MHTQPRAFIMYIYSSLADDAASLFPSNIFTPCPHTKSTAAYKTTRQREMDTETNNTTIPATAGEESNTSTTPDEGVLPAVDFGKDKYSCVGPIYEGLGNMWSFNMIPKCKVQYV